MVFTTFVPRPTIWSPCSFPFARKLPLKPQSATRRVSLNQAPRRIAVIANPATRRNATTIVNLLRSAAPKGTVLDVRFTPGPGTATEIARNVMGGVDAVVAIGGDGTVADIATALCGSSIPIGIVPAGSTNIVARELGIPTSTVAAIDLVFTESHLSSLDVGVCGDRCFLHMAGAGLDSRMFASTSSNLKRRIGWMAYVKPAIRHLFDPAAEFTLVVDGALVHVRSPLILVANGPSIITPRLPLYPEIWTDDGLLDVLIFTPRGSVAVARTLSRLATRGLPQSPFVTRIRAREVEIRSDPPLPVQLDGDVSTLTPCSFSVKPAAVQIISPKR